MPANDDPLTRHELDGPNEITVHAWPDDSVWADLVVGHVADGLPVLEDLVGLHWPVDRDLVVQETVSPSVYGYGGWYDSDSKRSRSPTTPTPASSSTS